MNVYKNKNAQGNFLTSFNWFTVIVVSFLAVMLFAGMIYIMGLINTQFQKVGILNDQANAGKAGYTNLTLAAQETFGQANTGVQSLRLVALCYIFSLIIATILVNFLIKKVHPVWFFVYVLIVLLAVILSGAVSNAYQTELTSGVFGGILPSFTGANWILINLPTVIAAGGLLGCVFLFVNIVRGEEGQLA